MPVFVKIFNIVFKSGIIPDCWSEGFICPIYNNKVTLLVQITIEVLQY